MAGLAAQRCEHHARREAVARCPACRRYFCRECVTEHDGRVLCAPCLQRLLQVAKGRRQIWRWGLRSLCSIGSFMVLWLLLYWLGQAFLSVPDLFHVELSTSESTGATP